MTRTITTLKLQKHNKERVSVFLDGEYAFSISLHVALALKRGQTLDEGDIERLQGEDEALRAYHHALHFLGYRPRSQMEVERHLRQKGHPPEAVGAAIERLQNKHYLDDGAFANAWVENRQRFRPRGVHALRYELRQKGVDQEIIESALADTDGDAAAWAAIERKLDRWQGLEPTAFRNKVTGFLSRRGFPYATVRSVCQRAWETVNPSDPPGAY